LLYDWPYNVRELLKVAAELRIRGAGAPSLELRLVVNRLDRGKAQAAEASGMRAPSPSFPPFQAAAPAQAQAPAAAAPAPIPTRDELVALLREHGGSVAEVGRATGRSRKQVYRWIESHGIDIESFRSES
jgi:DNA-binding NtrC family response regulator